MKVIITIEDEELKDMKNDTVRAMAKLLTGKDFDMGAGAENNDEPVVEEEAKAPKNTGKPAPEKQKPARKAEPVKEAEPEPAAEAEKTPEPEKPEKPERTADELKKALKEFCTSHDGGAAKIQAKFKELGITKASEATREQLERVLEEVNK